MAFEMKMPDLATTGSDVRVIRWLIEPGQSVRRGQMLLEVETDKAAVEVESVATGTLSRHLIAAGEEVASGQVICEIEQPVSASTNGAAAAPTVAAPSSTAASAPPASSPAPPTDTGAERPRGGMFARNREAAQQTAPASDSVTLSPSQRTIGRRMQESKQTVPHFYLEASFNAEPITAHRKAAGGKLAWDAFFVHAAGSALKSFEKISHRIDGDRLTAYSGGLIGVAVDLDGELFVLPVHSENTPEAISDEIRGGVEKMRSGDPESKRLQPGALTITNLGSTKVEQFYAIVNPPEAAILAIGRIAPTAVVVDGQIAAQLRGQITLSADHRVVNGKYAADFLTAVIDALEAI